MVKQLKLGSSSVIRVIFGAGVEGMAWMITAWADEVGVEIGVESCLRSQPVESRVAAMMTAVPARSRVFMVWGALRSVIIMILSYHGEAVPSRRTSNPVDECSGTA